MNYTRTDEAAARIAASIAREQRFGTVMSGHEGELHLSHLPLLVDLEDGRISGVRGHFARANPHWRALKSSPKAIILFSGPNAYVSAQWYSEGCPAAPTWNYAAVHVVGRIHLLDTAEQTTAIVDELVAVNEASQPHPWTIDRYSPERRQRLTPHILGFEIHIERVDARFKLSEHFADEDKLGVIANLRSQGSDHQKKMADLMEMTLGQGNPALDLANALRHPPDRG